MDIQWICKSMDDVFSVFAVDWGWFFSIQWLVLSWSPDGVSTEASATFDTRCTEFQGRTKGNHNLFGPRRVHCRVRLVIPSGNLLHSYWKWQFIVSFPMKHGWICPSFFVCLPGRVLVMSLSFWRTWLRIERSTDQPQQQIHDGLST